MEKELNITVMCMLLDAIMPKITGIPAEPTEEDLGYSDEVHDDWRNHYQVPVENLIQDYWLEDETFESNVIEISKSIKLVETWFEPYNHESFSKELSKLSVRLTGSIMAKKQGKE